MYIYMPANRHNTITGRAILKLIDLAQYLNFKNFKSIIQARIITKNKIYFLNI